MIYLNFTTSSLQHSQRQFVSPSRRFLNVYIHPLLLIQKRDGQILNALCILSKSQRLCTISTYRISYNFNVLKETYS